MAPRSELRRAEVPVGPEPTGCTLPPKLTFQRQAEIARIISRSSNTAADLARLFSVVARQRHLS